MRRAALLAAALLAAGCNNGFEKQSAITRVRVLAIQAEPADVLLPPDGGLPAPIQLRALAVTPDGRPVQVQYALCRPGDPFRADFHCPGADGLDLDGGVLDFGDPAVLRFLASGFDGGFAQSTPGTVQGTSVSLFVGYQADDGSGDPAQVERGIRSIPVRTEGPVNQNPQVAALTASSDGGAGAALPLDALPTTEIVLTPTLAPGSVEGYTDASGAHTEHLTYAWYATGDGGFVDLRSQEPVDGVGKPGARFDPPGAAQAFKVWVVARDDRGGVGWLEQDAAVR